VIVARLEGPSLGDVVAVARRGARVELGAESRERISASRGRVERAAGEGNRGYGVTTGFGALATTPVSVPSDGNSSTPSCAATPREPELSSSRRYAATGGYSPGAVLPAEDPAHGRTLRRARRPDQGHDAVAFDPRLGDT
jgi:Aromatic amino acid lyase